MDIVQIVGISSSLLQILNKSRMSLKLITINIMGVFYSLSVVVTLLHLLWFCLFALFLDK